MRKIASLLAVMALLAFAGMSFAATTTSVGDTEYTDEIHHNTKFDTNKATVYFMKGTTPSLDLGLQLKLNAAEAATVYGAVVSGEKILTTDDTDGDTEVPVKIQLGPKHTNLSDDITIKFGAYESSTGTLKSDNTEVTVTVMPKSVDITTSGDVELSFMNLVADTQVVSLDLPTELATNLAVDKAVVLAALSTDMKEIISVDLTETATTAKTFVLNGVSLDIAMNTATNQWAITAQSGTATVTAGEYTLAFVAKADDAVVDKTKKIAVAGMTGNQVSGEDYVVLAKVPFETMANPVTEILEDLSKDLKSDAVNVIVDGKVVPADGMITLSEDLGFVELTLVSLDASGNPEPLPAVVSADLGDGYYSAAADADVEHVSRTFIPEGLYTVTITVRDQDIDALETKKNPVTGTARGAIVPFDGEYHVHALGQARDLTYKTTVEVDDSKGSSGACSMGAGILALAGLALVLRKRG